ncbi:MAG: peptidase C14, partial [Methyloprofundus sp.]|nr:peptidase C14 [Methyloprofundus sp.]
GQSKTLQEKNQQLERLNGQLQQQNQNLKKQHTKIARLEAEKNQAIASQNEYEKTGNKNLELNNARINQLESKLAQREKTLNAQRSQILVMKKDKQKYELSIERLKSEKEQRLAYAKPSIEVLDPPFSTTRNTSIPSIRLRSIMTHREITGRISAPAGLLSFTINGISKEVNPSGIFKSRVKLQGQKTLVRTIAIDKRGNKSVLDFMLLPATSKVASTKDNKPKNTRTTTHKNIDVNFGPYHALIIGNQKYKHFSNLNTPVNDAQTVDKILREKYGFKTTLILNANRYDILSTLNKLRSKLTENDNLLIYYAGHGELDRVNLRGHWLPIDAEADNTANWISTIAITDIINAMSAKHVLIVADSCYSGAMTRSSLARLDAGKSDKVYRKWLTLMSKTRSRTVLTSGGLKPVLDNGSDGHSIFASAFIKAISNNDKILEGQQLYRKVYDRIQKVSKKLNFKQEPQYAPIRHGGHEAGDFFLVSKH